MRYIFLTLGVLILGGCVINPSVKEEIIEKPNGQVVEKDIVEEPVVEPVIEPVFDPFIEPVIDVPVIYDRDGYDRDGFRGDDGRVRFGRR